MQMDSRNAELAYKRKQMDSRNAELAYKRKQMDSRNAELAHKRKQMDSRNAELAYKRMQMAESQQRKDERRMRHIKLQAAQKSEAAFMAKELKKNNMTLRDLIDEMEIQRRTSRDVPYVDNTPLPPSEAETMQTVSIKDLYKRLKKPDALATAQTLSAPMSNLPVHPSPPAHSRHDATGSVAVPAPVPDALPGPARTITKSSFYIALFYTPRYTNL